MGTLDEGLALTILRNFQLAKLDREMQWQEELQARLSKPPVWSWTPGTFVFPEGLCCYCGGVMRSPAIWRAESLQFYGSWKVVSNGDGTGYFEFDGSHPHVIAGSICMGSETRRASSAADALFLAFNPLSSYFGAQEQPDGAVWDTNTRIKAWLADRFDHRCGFRTKKQRTITGIDNRHVVAAVDGCHCQHCRGHRGEVRCSREGCGEWYDPRRGHGQFTCTICNRHGNVHFCYQHKHELVTCVTCSESQDLFDVATGERIPDEIRFIESCPRCDRPVCHYCLNETADHVDSDECEESRNLGTDSDGECDHHCSSCCEEHGCTRCEDCDLYPSDCSC
jgi:hypothetical protein